MEESKGIRSDDMRRDSDDAGPSSRQGERSRDDAESSLGMDDEDGESGQEEDEIGDDEQPFFSPGRLC